MSAVEKDENQSALREGVRALATNFAVLWMAFLLSKLCYGLIVMLLSRSWRAPIVAEPVLMISCAIAVAATAGFIAFRMEWLSSIGLRAAADKAESSPSAALGAGAAVEHVGEGGAQDQRLMAFCFLQQNRAVVLLGLSETVAVLGMVAALNCQEARLYMPFFAVSVVLMLLTPLRLENLIDRAFDRSVEAVAIKTA